MPLIQWTGSLSVQIAGIDTQHQKLLGLMNDLYDAVLNLRGQAELAGILAAMGAYAKEHFSFEEREMFRCAYTDTKQHQAEHHAFTEFVQDAEKKLRGGEFVSSVELLEFLRSWITHHIREVDTKYGTCLRAGGVS